MNTITRLLILFLAITGVSTILINEFQVDFGLVNYWQNHGLFFLIFLTLFPRLTLLFSSVVSGGFLWWLGWLFAPRLLVAILSTIGYWKTNPVLVIMAWIIALGGESSEKSIVINRGKPFKFKRTIIVNGKNMGGGNSPYDTDTLNDGDTIEADFKVKSETDS